MADSSLQKYIADLKAKNISESSIKDNLIKSGWSQQDVDKAFISSLPSTELPPPPVPHYSMWITFEYLILFLAMYASFTSLGGILHYAVDLYFPDPNSVLNNLGSYQSTASSYLLVGYMASIIITYPIFAILFLHINKSVAKNPGIRNIRSRKLLIYITLVITFIYMISHLIMTVFSFFLGTSSLQTALHLGVNLLVAGSIFGYLIYGIRGDRKNNA